MPIDSRLLLTVPFFASLDEADLAHVAAVTVERRFERGDIILLEGDLGGALHFVCEGRIKIFKTSPDGKEQVLRLITAGATFNDVPALDGGPNPASAAAMEPTTVLVTGRADLQRLIRERPGVAAAAIRTLAAALRHLVSVVESLSFHHVSGRVAGILYEQEMANQQGGQPYRLTQQEMAAMAGTAREMVGRALKELESLGAIEMRHGRVVVIDTALLKTMAERA